MSKNYKEIKEDVSKAVKEAVREHLSDYDSYNDLPAVMSLKEASELTGVSVQSLRAKNDKGIIDLIRAGNGRGKLRIKKSELLKALTQTE